MKKIGIITYFYYYNYGTMLQGYATCRIFDKLSNGDYNSELIDCRYGEKKKTRWQMVLIRFRRLFVYMIELNRVRKIAKFRNESALKNTIFEQFVKECCHLSRKTYQTSNDLETNPPVYDLYVTGSDQTWSPKIGLRATLFLGFAPDSKVRASYAPSIGVSSYTPEQESYVKEKLQKYQFVSCRERYGADILNRLSPVSVETVLDPTFMVKANEWREIAIKPNVKGKYILCYFIGDRLYYRKFAQQLSKQLSLKLFFIPVSYVDFSKDDNLLWKSGPKEFLGLIDNAEVVLTDSFHGSIFSINFNKSFYSFVKHAGASSMDNMRIIDILERMGLKDRLIMEYNDGEIGFSPIDFTKTNELLAEERELSENYIRKILEAI